MIIEAQDGRYYRDPVLISENAITNIPDDEQWLELIVRKGISLRQACDELGIQIKRPAHKPFDLWATFSCGKYLSGNCYMDVQLKAPIPVPEKHRGVSDYVSDAKYGERSITWNRKYPVAMILGIKEGHRDKGTGYTAVRDFLGATDKTFNRKFNKQDLTATNGLVTLRRKDAYVF